jgi:glycosyltransferase involved in cell wall biosynthesis
MKKILITMSAMFIGGAERSLIGLLNSIDYREYTVDLFLYRHEGEFLHYIPEDVELLPLVDKYTTFDRPIKDILKSKLWFYGVLRLLAKTEITFRSKIKKQEMPVWPQMQVISKYITPFLPNIEGKYDLAINFIGIHDVLGKKINAKCKAGWIHTDYMIQKPIKQLDLKTYAQIDKIVNVSEECKVVFDKFYPQLKNKSNCIENILSANFIINQAVQEVIDMPERNDGEVILCSVGRFCEAKNFDNVPKIAKRITKKGIQIKWILIGFGTDEKIIRESIKETEMEETVFVLGKKENPYPYIKKCDIYVQPSRYEGKAVTVREAQILNKPVVITDFSTANSQLKDGYDGLIVPMDLEQCAEKLAEFILNKDKQKVFVENTKREDYTNSKEIEKLYRLMEE